MSDTSLQTRNVAIDAVKTIAIFGTILIHVTANGGFSHTIGSLPFAGAVFQKPLPQHIYFFKTPFLDLKTSRFSKINVRPDH